MADEQPKTTRRAPVVEVEHTKRKMKSYLVYEWELDQLSTLDGWTTLFGSVGSFFASLALGLWTDLFVEGSPSPAAQEYGNAMKWWFLGIAAIFYVCAALAWYKRWSKTDQMKREIA